MNQKGCYGSDTWRFLDLYWIGLVLYWTCPKILQKQSRESTQWTIRNLYGDRKKPPKVSISIGSFVNNYDQ